MPKEKDFEEVVHVRVPEGFNARLKKIAKLKAQSKSQTIRDGLVEWIKEMESAPESKNIQEHAANKPVPKLNSENQKATDRRKGRTKSASNQPE